MGVGSIVTAANGDGAMWPPGAAFLVVTLGLIAIASRSARAALLATDAALVVRDLWCTTVIPWNTIVDVRVEADGTANQLVVMTAGGPVGAVFMKHVFADNELRAVADGIDAYIRQHVDQRATAAE